MKPSVPTMERLPATQLTGHMLIAATITTGLVAGLFFALPAR